MNFLKALLCGILFQEFIHPLKIYITALLLYFQNNSQSFIDKKLESSLYSILSSLFY